MRWISSTKRTSPSLRPDRIAARSPAWVIAGPLVSRSGVLISAAMIIASVVLPSPGGPESSTWSGARPRRRAASRTSPSWSRTRACPTTSSSVLGRSAASTARSSPSASASVSRCRWPSSASVSSTSSVSSSVSSQFIVGTVSRLAQRAEGGAQQGADVGGVAGVGGDGLDRLLRLLGRPAQPDEALLHLVAPGVGGRGGGRGRVVHADRRADAVLELEDDALGALLTDPRDAGQGLDVLGRDGAAYVVGGHHRDDRLRDLGADPGRGLDDLEDGLLVVVEEPEDRQAVLAHDHAGGQRGGLADAERGEGARGAHQLQPDAADLEDGAGQGDGGDLAADEGDHRFLIGSASGGRGPVPGPVPRRPRAGCAPSRARRG